MYVYGCRVCHEYLHMCIPEKYIHAYIHTYIHTYIQSDEQSAHDAVCAMSIYNMCSYLKYTNIHTYIYTYIHTYSRMSSLRTMPCVPWVFFPATRLHARSSSAQGVYVCIYMCVCVCVFIHMIMKIFFPVTRLHARSSSAQGMYVYICMRPYTYVCVCDMCVWALYTWFWVFFPATPVCTQRAPQHNVCIFL